MTSASMLAVISLLLVGTGALTNGAPGDQSLWPKGIVPYKIDPELKDVAGQYQKSMSLIEKNTCIRFIPWNETTSDKEGLGHQAYLNFVNGKGCRSTPLGNISQAGSRDISCCDLGCLQELARALGVNVGGKDIAAADSSVGQQNYLLSNVYKAYNCRDCPTGYRRYKSQCYTFRLWFLEYDKAEAVCRSKNGHLAAPKDKDENDFVSSLSDRTAYWTVKIWLGATDRVKEGEWVWSDGTNMEWNNWNRNCTTGYYKKCYAFKEKTKSWDDAHKTCQGMGGYIATPENQDESSFVSKLRGRYYIWIGATDRANQGDWRLEDGSKLEFPPWQYVSDPYDGQDCAVLDKYHKLQERECFRRFAYVCVLPSRAVQPSPDQGQDCVTMQLKSKYWFSAGCSNNDKYPFVCSSKPGKYHPDF